MTEQDGPGEIERTILRSAVCLWCLKTFLTVAEAKAHDATCPQHPAVIELARAMDAERREQSRLIDERDAARRQLAMAKRLVGAIVASIQEGTTDEETLAELLVADGIVTEERYDPVCHGEILPAYLEIDPGDSLYVIDEAWRV